VPRPARDQRQHKVALPQALQQLQHTRGRRLSAASGTGCAASTISIPDRGAYIHSGLITKPSQGPHRRLDGLCHCARLPCPAPITNDAARRFWRQMRCQRLHRVRHRDRPVETIGAMSSAVCRASLSLSSHQKSRPEGTACFTLTRSDRTDVCGRRRILLPGRSTTSAAGRTSLDCANPLPGPPKSLSSFGLFAIGPKVHVRRVGPFKVVRGPSPAPR